ncbi:MAG: NAD-dependent epimerase/dehydratase family protein [Candidatus Lokiarchaeota archaeon]|nr:NAD-dependent epimerase/dehydratase family protein [Candidatus Lokiarchaeota archaeon]MBD3212951.1 NAD-dependent epimerase/dehydratase family protein [Candidatus Lokiarchaeota archaeon]
MELEKNYRIYITGYTGMVGVRLLRYLENNGYNNLITTSSSSLDLRNQKKVDEFFNKENPQIVIHLAAKVGGIASNIKYPAEYLYDNLMMQTNVIHSAHKYNCEKLVFLGSSCIYPRETPQPMKEEYLMTGKLEPTNKSYAVAKIAGIQMCQAYHSQYNSNFISLIPCNLYGPGDHYGNFNSHVMAALLDRFHKAKIKNKNKVIVWGSGNPRREFLFVDDLVSAILFLLKNYNDPSIINVGTGTDISIKNLAYKIKAIVGFEGKIEFDETKPDGMMKKLLDVSKIEKLGWKAETDLDIGIKKSYKSYLEKYKE